MNVYLLNKNLFLLLTKFSLPLNLAAQRDLFNPLALAVLSSSDVTVARQQTGSTLNVTVVVAVVVVVRIC